MITSLSISPSWTRTVIIYIIIHSILISFINVEAYFLVIDAHAEECFFDRIVSGTKMGLSFEVVEGGFLDIDVTITGANDFFI